MAGYNPAGTLGCGPSESLAQVCNGFEEVAYPLSYWVQWVDEYWATLPMRTRLLHRIAYFFPKLSIIDDKFFAWWREKYGK